MGRGIGRRNIGRGRNQGNTPRDGIVKAHTGTRSSRLAKAFPPPGLEPRGPSEVGDRRAQPGAAGGRFDNAVADRRLERRMARGRRYSPIPIPRISQSASRQYPKGKSQPAKYPTRSVGIHTPANPPVCRRALRDMQALLQSRDTTVILIRNYIFQRQNSRNRDTRSTYPGHTVVNYSDPPHVLCPR